MAAIEGNVFVGPSMKTLKWTAENMAMLDGGKFPHDAEATETAVFGDIEKGFKEADLIVERDMHQQTTSHQPLESRSCMAYWQNGKCYMHVSTQSLARTVASVAGWVGIKPDELVLISEYTGGGFGSKIPGAQSMAIPALMSKKLNGNPVMMRVSRAEETYIGRVRPGYQGWIKMGFKKDGRVTAIDTFIVEASGPYRRQGDHSTTANLGSLLFQAPNMRFRGISVATNTPPGVSQRAPGGLQASVWFEPLVHEAAKKLGIDQVAIRKLNAPEGQALFGLVPPNTPPGPEPLIKREPCACDLGGPVEIDDIQALPELDVIPGFKTEYPRLAPPSHFHVIRGILSDRHGFMGHIRDPQEEFPEVVIRIRPLAGEVLYFVRQAP